MIIGGQIRLKLQGYQSSHIKAVFDNLMADEPKNNFTVGIVDDVTFTSLEVRESINTIPEGTVSCKFWGLGSDGTVGANQSAIKIIGDNTDKYAQGYFSYDSKKSGGVTVSHLRFGDKPIKSTYLIDEADYIACHNEAYVNQFDLIEGLKDGGTFVLNCTWSKEELDEKLPASMKKYLAEKNINFYIINAFDIAQRVGLGRRINMVMQTVFFKLANILPVDEAIKYLKEAIKENYGHRGDKIVEMNWQAVDAALEALQKVDVPAEWANAETEAAATQEDDRPEFIKNILEPIAKQKGDSLPVSAFVGREDGHFPPGTAAYEKT